MLDWDMVREMQAARITFGSHSVTHPDFSCLTLEEAREEVSESRRRIEEHLGSPVTAFAYPYGKRGSFDDSTIAVLRDARYRWAFTTENGQYGPRADPFTLRRDDVRDVPAYVLAVRLSGVFEHPMLRQVEVAGRGTPRRRRVMAPPVCPSTS